MGTRSLTIFNDEWKNEEIVVFYRQYDGYPEGHGTELLTFIDNMKIVNGISLYKDERIANGMGCLAAQVISHFKEETGNFYLYSAGTRDIGEEFIYTLYYKNDKLKIKVQDTYDKGHDLFDGNMTQYNEWLNTPGITGDKDTDALLEDEKLAQEGEQNG
jgi:hypothetical protein